MYFHICRLYKYPVDYKLILTEFFLLISDESLMLARFRKIAQKFGQLISNFVSRKNNKPR